MPLQPELLVPPGDRWQLHHNPERSRTSVNQIDAVWLLSQECLSAAQVVDISFREALFSKFRVGRSEIVGHPTRLRMVILLWE
jgi:hypothetical protein